MLGMRQRRDSIIAQNQSGRTALASHGKSRGLWRQSNPRSANDVTPAAGDDEVVERADVDQRQRLLQRLRQELVGARLGSATPDGWLCAKITAAALRASAVLTTSRG